jgi:hypothetical protein
MYMQCVATLWALVEKRRIDRVGAVEAEPICKQIAEMMKVVDLSNVIHGGTSALTPEQIAMLNGMLGRTMQDVFRSAYQTSVLFRCVLRLATCGCQLFPKDFRAIFRAVSTFGVLPSSVALGPSLDLTSLQVGCFESKSVR